MTTLNNSILKLSDKSYIHASTDISGAGLAGSLYELATQNSVEIIVNAKDVPYYEQALTYAMSMEEDGALFNRNYVGSLVRFDESVSKGYENLFYDPQTSGGLLLAVAPSELNHLADKLHADGVMAEKLVIGQVLDEGSPRVLVA